MYQKQGKYQDALEVLKGLREFHPKHEYYLDWEKELNALIESKKLNSFEPVYGFLRYFREKYSESLPPKNYTFGSIDKVSTILRLYDTIGDYDAGIAYVDEILDWAYKKDDEEIGPLKGRIKTAEEATVCMKLDYEVAKERGLDRAACRWLREYLLVREAFEQDKTQATKGRATKALIQSDYFPW